MARRSGGRSETAGNESSVGAGVGAAEAGAAAGAVAAASPARAASGRGQNTAARNQNAARCLAFATARSLYLKIGGSPGSALPRRDAGKCRSKLFRAYTTG